MSDSSVNDPTGAGTRSPTVPDTFHEGIQRCLDVLHDRRSALNSMFREAERRRDSEAMSALLIRLDELGGTLSSVRARVSS